MSVVINYPELEEYTQLVKSWENLPKKQRLKNEYDFRMKPYKDLDKKRMEYLNKICFQDIDIYNEIFLKVLNSVYDNFKVNEYFVFNNFLYIIYDYNSPEKIPHEEIIQVLGDYGCKIGYKNKILLKGDYKLNSVLPSQAVKDADSIFSSLYDMGY